MEPGARVPAGREVGRRPDELRADARRNRARILEAAAAVFAEKGRSASTAEIANRAGVAVGTVFRHFPTKDELIRALLKDLLTSLTARARSLLQDSEPGTALFTFFTWTVERAAAQKAIVDLLAEAGVEVRAAQPVQSLAGAVHPLLDAARRAGTVRAEVQLDEVLALLAATCQGAVSAGWDTDLQRRTLAIIFAGLRPAGDQQGGDQPGGG
jgi:AcrR family transcriptional regulator